jgi:hypothetical protein
MTFFLLRANIYFGRDVFFISFLPLIELALLGHLTIIFTIITDCTLCIGRLFFLYFSSAGLR